MVQKVISMPMGHELFSVMKRRTPIKSFSVLVVENPRGSMYDELVFALLVPIYMFQWMSPRARVTPFGLVLSTSAWCIGTYTTTRGGRDSVPI